MNASERDLFNRLSVFAWEWNKNNAEVVQRFHAVARVMLNGLLNLDWSIGQATALARVGDIVFSLTVMLHESRRLTVLAMMKETGCQAATVGVIQAIERLEPNGPAVKGMSLYMNDVQISDPEFLGRFLRCAEKIFEKKYSKDYYNVSRD
ncbi:MAG: hypothetical protein A2928_04230 [Candidatus Taylorbacteria bacterium RIFCSPLOWO2_01_FULL_45_15b]|uniref:Uncharacterized protein n=1 Tax=Candidatus Taylorbacteria bacterium RIFCSPLOWO2_01_FULL_45_15b TaxID=1802319 RepID=A0A1G2NEI8_9BACT|nr:MAG: hypothetical protein A2928_04230 [Candidatus Taylorbacteria bacterium RIFCSPLOWO2_01_FULL_45_15b]